VGLLAKEYKVSSTWHSIELNSFINECLLVFTGHVLKSKATSLNLLQHSRPMYACLSSYSVCEGTTSLHVTHVLEKLLVWFTVIHTNTRWI